MPFLALMVRLANPEATQGLVQMLASGFLLPGETHQDVEISVVAAPLPIELNVAFPEDAILLTSGLEETKQIIDLMKAGETSGMFAAQEPALDPATPRFTTIMLDESLLTEVAMPLSGLVPAPIPPEVEVIVDQVTSAVRQVRIVNDVRGEWQASAVSIYMTE